ncbi:MAG: Fur family transcriptional regulator [Aureispira sp.]
MKTTRKTTAKTQILELLEKVSTALSHKEIQVELDGLCNRVTIYRVLERLLEEGFIHRIVNTDGVVKYARCHSCNHKNHHHNHLHFSCTQCQEVTCLQQVQPSYQLPSNYLAQEVHFTVSGICPKCLEN